MKFTSTGNFEISTWNEEAYVEQADGTKQSHAKITQTYRGDIEGSSSLQYLMSYHSPTVAEFVGFETIIAAIGDKKGQFIVRHLGKFEDGVASSSFVVVAHSGTDDFSGLYGSGEFSAPAGGVAQYLFNFEL
ncbi:DUF3224 domain-containing protein [Thalassotalea atypica]|uniref:DUF3224 domain-containing protein n=1 Tax=Thalassotalea atypica TaxID=2054316 RepID=UPI0025745640|nr:DUF3224 domain-containing protein [Thalassotalea atypica]